jgi:predicted DNA-binding protein
MKRETVTEKVELRLPPERKAKLSAAADRGVTTKSEILRQALIARLRELDPTTQPEAA